jgi:uncharacterized protein YijF (DUF1287 family)
LIALLAVLFTSHVPGAEAVLRGARQQLVRPAIYTPGYFRLAYPNGDLPADKGVCTDVVIRALRTAGKDLQRLIHEDMGRRFSTYPRRGEKRDPNIDHRRVPNHIHFLRRYGTTLPNGLTGPALATWHPGDLVYWKLDNGLDHCGVVSDRRNGRGLPLVIHNIWQTAEEDVLDRWRIVGHYRYPRG